MGTDSGETFCSLCYEEIPDDAARTLWHVQKEHADSDKFLSFIHATVVRQFCSKCGAAFWSDVDVLSDTMFGARSYCQDCRRQNRAFKNLLTDSMDTRELVSRGLVRPELSRDNRRVDADQ